MIITEIALKNFQIHKNTNVKLNEFTAIIGKSSAGKSSIMRALMWLIYGEWDKTYPTDPEVQTEAAIRLSNGAVIVRRRLGAKNKAVVIMPGKDPVLYQDFGEHIPGLFDLMNLRPIQLGTKSVNLNFSMQNDPIFMVHESRPAKAQWLGRLYGAHVVNAMLRMMSKDKRNLESTRKRLEGELEDLQSKIVGYDDVALKKPVLITVEQDMVTLESMKECSFILETARKELIHLQNNKKLLEFDIESARNDVKTLNELYDLRGILDSITAKDAEIASRSAILHFDCAVVRDDARLLEDLSIIKKDLVDADWEITEGNKELRKTKKDLAAEKKNIKEAVFATGKCPLCRNNKKTSADTLTKNLKNLIGA